MRQKPAGRPSSSEQIIQDIKRKTRKQYSAEDEAPRYLLRDRDAIYGQAFHRQATVLKINEIFTAPRSPWQNPYAERVIGSIRRECVDQVIVLGERHLRRILKSYMNYYNGTRTHISLNIRTRQKLDRSNLLSVAALSRLRVSAASLKNTCGWQHRIRRMNK